MPRAGASLAATPGAGVDAGCAGRATRWLPWALSPELALKNPTIAPATLTARILFTETLHSVGCGAQVQASCPRGGSANTRSLHRLEAVRRSLFGGVPRQPLRKADPFRRAVLTPCPPLPSGEGERRTSVQS